MAVTVKTETFALQIKIFRFLGISLKQKDGILFHLYSFVVIIAIVGLPILAIQAAYITMDDFQRCLASLVVSSSSSTTSIKLLGMYATRKKFGKILKLLQAGVFVPNTNRGGVEEEKLNRKYTATINRQTKALYILTVVYAFSPSLEIVTRKISGGGSTSYMSLPFGDFYLFNTTYNPNFNFAWAYQTLAHFMGCLAYCAIDGFIAGIMAYLSLQCLLLQNLIKKCILRSHAEMVQQEKLDEAPLEVPKIKWKYLQEALKEIIAYHVDIIQIRDAFEEVFCVQALFNFLGLSVVICLSIVYSTSMNAFNFRYVEQLALLSGSVSLQLMTAYWGHEVILQHDAIGKACYEVDFVGADIRFQKGLRLMIQRTQRPVQFTVGKFAPLTLNTFVVVMKTAYSYYTLVHKVKET